MGGRRSNPVRSPEERARSDPRPVRAGVGVSVVVTAKVSP
jgi:hypothetical protein